MERSVLRGLAALRWVGWVWMAAVATLARASLDRPLLAAGLVVLALAVTVVATARLGEGVDAATAPWLVGAEVAVGAALLLADGFVYDAAHVFSPEAQLGVAWPLAGVLLAGVVWGSVPGIGVGLAFGACRAVSSVLHAPTPDPAGPVLFGSLQPDWVLSLVTTTVLYVAAGGVAGYAAELLRRSERQVARAQSALAQARAREEVARTLHDGVLQTLAIVERRAADPELANLARRQDRELRTYLYGQAGADVIGRGGLGDALRAAAARFEDTFGGRADVLVPDDLPSLDAQRGEALVGAVGEALTNVGKHARAGRVVVFVEPDDGGVFCSVKDDGVGFDPQRVAEGEGLRSSVRRRVTEVGGTVRVVSAPGRGTEVRLRVPAG